MSATRRSHHRVQDARDDVKNAEPERGKGVTLTVLAPMAIEARAARAGLQAGARADKAVHHVGMGPRSAKRLAAITAHRKQFGPIVVAGFGGGLHPDLRCGDIVLASELRGPQGIVACADPTIFAGMLERHGLPVRVGPVVSSRLPVIGRKRTRLAASGALVADMESAWLAAAPSGDDLLVLRVVLDLPSHANHDRASALAGARRAYRNLREACALLDEWAAAFGPREVLLAAPRASCAGVARAVEIVERALEARGRPVYVRKQIVHNAHVVAGLERRGAVFVEEVDEVPRGATAVFSAHGVSPAVRAAAAERGLDVIDATCPLVAKVHAEARRFAEAGFDIVLVGHEGHEEVEGTVGEAPTHTHVVANLDEAAAVRVRDPQRVAYLTQTTLAVDETAEVVEALRERFPNLSGPASSDICYATQNRQDAVRALAGDCDCIFVVGSENSSNSRRLVEVAQRAGCPAMLISDANQIPPEVLAGRARLGVTAGASAPETLVQGVIRALSGVGAVTVTERVVAREEVRFKLPPQVASAEV